MQQGKNEGHSFDCSKELASPVVENQILSLTATRVFLLAWNGMLPCTEGTAATAEHPCNSLSPNSDNGEDRSQMVSMTYHIHIPETLILRT